MAVLLAIFCRNNLMAFSLMHLAVVRAICGKMSLPRFFPEAIGNFWQAFDHQKYFFTFFKYMIHDTLKSHVWPSFMTHRALYTRLRAGLRDKELEEKQLQLLLSGWKALKSGGYLVYHAWVQRQNNFWPNDWFQNDRNSNDLNSDAGACLIALIASNLVLLFVKVSPSSSRNQRHFHNAVGGVSCSQASDRLYSKPV